MYLRQLRIFLPLPLLRLYPLPSQVPRVLCRQFLHQLRLVLSIRLSVMPLRRSAHLLLQPRRFKMKYCSPSIVEKMLKVSSISIKEELLPRSPHTLQVSLLRTNFLHFQAPGWSLKHENSS
jgi:hypothetical protein